MDAKQLFRDAAAMFRRNLNANQGSPMSLTTQPRWPTALSALEPHERARDLIHEYAEVREDLAKNPRRLDAVGRRELAALERWFAANWNDAEVAELDGDHDELIRLAASLQAVLDGLEAIEKRENQE